MAILYRHLKTNGEVFYIGIGRTEKRAYSKQGRNNYWNKVMNKYGYEIQILKSNLSWEEACELEKILISWYGRKDLGNGCLVNMTDGGDGVSNNVCSIKTRNKIREALKNNTNMLGKKHSEDTKLGMSVSRKGRGFTKEHRKKISNSLIGNKNNLKTPILQLTKEGELVREWDGASTVEKVLGFNQSNITECCKKIRKTAYKYKWEYKIK
jgi:hypothetical protein